MLFRSAGARHALRPHATSRHVTRTCSRPTSALYPSAAALWSALCRDSSCAATSSARRSSTTAAWRAADDALVAAADGAELRLRYYARSVYAVLGGTGRVQVTRDGVTVTLRVGGPPRLRTLLGNDGPASGQVVLTLDAGVRVYALSFG